MAAFLAKCFQSSGSTETGKFESVSRYQENRSPKNYVALLSRVKLRSPLLRLVGPTV
ncbi:hypothetical protein J0895_22195 [Phormidium pseudopriestleyi FRX01]|uniref:Uncharacterized protein n=1 Tax=Phormidium pseudopriestleyi FRX01 TaxID=1759528 RepID=A0ABS3FXA9_9CYAN|nr:hypothetical protein [Phormidium pseudopriestleyi]MBO0351741.1 hypothetical protein [Phormidium pseudopriestleyi FRX01]